jgi:hypothetical protein
METEVWAAWGWRVSAAEWAPLELEGQAEAWRVQLGQLRDQLLEREPDTGVGSAPLEGEQDTRQMTTEERERWGLSSS